MSTNLPPALPARTLALGGARPGYVPAHATRRGSARLFIVDACIHGGSGSERVR